jgi:hypothetical protein
MLEQPKDAIKADIVEQTRQDTPDKTGQDKMAKRGFIDRVKDIFKEKNEM